MRVIEGHGTLVKADAATCLDATCGWAVGLGSETVVNKARTHVVREGHPVRLTRTRSVVLVVARKQAPA